VTGPPTSVDVVGVDLAWTQRGGTGLCHVREGRVLASTRVGPTDEIVAWIAPRIAGACVVGLDAPLVVPDDGRLRRGCDDLVSRVFGANHASTHSAHRGLPAFRDGGRAHHLAAALGLEVDPLFAPRTPGRRAIEVYPHAAIVGLFDLPFILRYKAKRRRTRPYRSAELRCLLDLLESLTAFDPPLDVRSSPRWPEIRAAVAEPASGAALSRVEDEIDAYVCAYVALAWWRRDGVRCRAFGDRAGGAIVTPVTPHHAARLDALLAATSSAPSDVG